MFQAYDVRAIYPDDLNESLAAAIARSTAIFLEGKRIVIGRDGRLSSPALHKAVVEALVKEGVEVLDLGLCTSPLFYFAIVSLKADGGLMVTASHNPPNYNGLKIQREMAKPVNSESGLKEIEILALKNEFTDKEGGKVTPVDIMHDYVAHVKQFASSLKPLKVVLDTSNGPSALTAPKILSELGVTVIHLNKEIDGNFPGHDPNPMKGEVVAALGEAVVSNNADMGVVYDADADRAFFVDEKGVPVTGEQIYAVMAEYFLEKHPGATLVNDLRMGWHIRDTIAKHGGTQVTVRVGRSFIFSCMEEHDAFACGEMSGHFYFKDNYFSDSAIIPTLIVLSRISSQGVLSSLINKNYFTSGEINFKVTDKDTALREIEERYKDGEIDKRDGVRIEFSDWWFIVRKSNTEPLIRLVAEAKTQEILDSKVKEISDYLSGLG